MIRFGTWLGGPTGPMRRLFRRVEALRTSRVFRRICGFMRVAEVPSESTFSRAFAEFAEMGLGEKVHQALVEQ